MSIKLLKAWEMLLLYRRTGKPGILKSYKYLSEAFYFIYFTYFIHFIYFIYFIFNSTHPQML